MSRKLVLCIASAVAICALLTNSAQAAGATVYENNYDTQTPGNGFPAWNWGDNVSHTALFADYGGNIVVEHSGVINNAGASAFNARFGSKWDLAMTGNTSPNPADYTISFDVLSLSGNWDPINLEFFVLTYNPAQGAGTYGLGSGASPYAQSAGWVHVEKTLDQLAVGWWEGTAWDLTNPTWSMELGGPPWPGTAVNPGESFTQVWLMDNLKITMVPEPSTLALLVGGFGLLAGWRRYRRAS